MVAKKPTKNDSTKEGKAKLDAARRKPIKDTRSILQKIQTKTEGGFEGKATVGYKTGQVTSTKPGKFVPLPFPFPDKNYPPMTMVKSPKKKKK
jgi:hypothetical protein